MPPDLHRPLSPATGSTGWEARTGDAAWAGALTRLAIALAALVALCAREWWEMFHQWWNIDTYNHILLIPPIIAWLVSLRRDEIARAEPRGWFGGLALVGAGLALWLGGRASGINLLAHAGAVGAVQGAVIALLGPRVSALLALPLGLAVFLVPFGDEMIPALQMITAKIAIALTHWSGVPASIDGIYIQTPVALFVVAEACSGVKFLVAMVTLGVLVCFTRFVSLRRRALFMAAAVIVPILANGVRAWGTIFIAQSQGVEFAAGFDHIVYGWVFFGVVVAVLLGAAWRFFERDPDDHGWSADELDRFGPLARAEARTVPSSRPFIAILVLALAAAIVALAAIG